MSHCGSSAICRRAMAKPGWTSERDCWGGGGEVGQGGVGGGIFTGSSGLGKKPGQYYKTKISSL